MEGQIGLALFIAPIPKAIFLDNLSMCVCYRRFSSINNPSDLTEETFNRNNINRKLKWVRQSAQFDLHAFQKSVVKKLRVFDLMRSLIAK